MLPGLVAVFALVLMALFPASLPPAWRFQPTISAINGFNFSAPVIVRLALGLARSAPAVVANASQPSFDELLGCHVDRRSFGPVVLDPLGPVQHVRNDSQVLPPPAEQFHALVVPSSAPTDLAIVRSDLVLTSTELVVGSTDLVLTSTDLVVFHHAIAFFTCTDLVQFSQSLEHSGVVHAMLCWQTGMARMALRIKSRLLDALAIARDVVNESSSSLPMHGVATLLLLAVAIIQLVLLVGLTRKIKRLECHAGRKDASSDRPADHPAPAAIAIPIQWIDRPASIVVTWSNTVKTANATPTPDTKFRPFVASIPLFADVPTTGADLIYFTAPIPLRKDAKTDVTELLLLAASIALPEDAKADEIELLLLAASIPLPEDAKTDDADLLLLAASIPLPEDAKADETELLLLAASIPLPEDVLATEIELLLLAASIALPEDTKTDDADLLLLAASIPLPEDVLATEIELLLLAASIPPTNDIPSVVSILPSDDILTDDKPNAAVPDTTAILVSPPVVNDHLTSTAESPATSTDLAPAPQDAAVSAAQDPITHSQSVVERVKSAEPAVVARAREFGERTGDQLAITQVIAYSPTRLEFDVRWLVKIGTSDRNQVHVSFFEPSVAKRLLRQTVKTEMSDETIESIVKTPYDPSVKKNIRRGGKNKKR